MAFERGSGKFRAEQAFYAANQFLRLKGFADQFIGFTAMALSATVLLTTPDIKMTGIEPNSGCCLICVQTE